MEACRRLVIDERCDPSKGYAAAAAAPVHGAAVPPSCARLSGHHGPIWRCTRLTPRALRPTQTPPRLLHSMNPLGIDQRRMVVAACPTTGQLLGMGQLVPLEPGLSELRSLVVESSHRCARARNTRTHCVLR